MTEDRVPTLIRRIRRETEPLVRPEWRDQFRSILASIEAEAAQPAPPLDVERLGTAMHNTGVTLCDNGGPGSSLDDVAAEYERLARDD